MAFGGKAAHVHEFKHALSKEPGGVERRISDGASWQLASDTYLLALGWGTGILGYVRGCLHYAVPAVSLVVQYMGA